MQSVNPTTTLESTLGSKASSRSRKHRHSHSSYRYQTRIKRYKYLLAGVSTLFIVIYIFTWFHISRKSIEHEQMLITFRKQEIAMKAVTSELETVRNELNTLIQERIPGLLPLVYDETIAVNDKYIRNIIFTLVKNGKKRKYEYHLVMHNDTLSVIKPAVEILLFNDIGIQIGRTQIDYDDISTVTGTERPVLDPGEVRTYTSYIDLIREEEPSYFLLVVSESKQASAERLRDHLGDIISP